MAESAEGAAEKIKTIAMRKICYFLVFLFFFQLSFGSRHFRYVIKEDGVYGGSYGQLTKIEGADPETFEFIDGQESPWGLVVTYAKDKNRVYYYTNVVEGADPESFGVLEEWYVKDKNHVYNARSNHEIFQNYDASTFEVLGNWFVKDKNGAYYEHNLSKEAIKIAGADAPSFEILWGTNYLKDKNHVYYYQEKDYGELIVKIFEEVDPATFVVDVASSPYSRDAKNIYWNGERLTDADPNTFKLIMKTPYGTDGKNVYYQATKLLDAEAGQFKLENKDVGVTDRYVYYYGTKLEGIHPDNFTFCNKYYPHYIKNNSMVYYHNIRVEGADAATFEEKGGWGREGEDKNHRYIGAEIDEEEPILFGVYESGVYFRNRKYEELYDADPKMFKILSKYYGKDKKAVYCGSGYKMENVDVKTFEIITESVGRDRTSVYCGRAKIVGADPKTYVPLNSRYGRDNKNIFYDERMIKNVDISSFEVLSNLYAKDKDHLFFQGSVIKNSDPESFQKIDNMFCKDKNHVYLEDKIIENADPASFETFKETYKDYSKDKNHVYFKTAVVEDADPETFERYLGSGLWIDKNYVFYNGEKLEDADASTFEPLDGSYYRDKNNIYYQYEKVDVDISSFKILSKLYAIDKNHVYVNGKIEDRYDVKTFDIKDRYY